MALFDTSVPLKAATPSEARIGTPSVTLDVQALVGGRRLTAVEAFEGQGGLSLRRYAHESLAAESILLPFTRKVSEGRVDGCAVAVWRILALVDTPPVELLTVREPDSLELETSYRSPSCVYAHTWRGRGTRVSVGTPDAAMMTIPEKHGWFPERLSDQVEEDCLGETIAPFGPYIRADLLSQRQGGVVVTLPPLLAGERVQAHFTVAWAKAWWIERRDYGTINAVGLLGPSLAMAAVGVS